MAFVIHIGWHLINVRENGAVTSKTTLVANSLGMAYYTLLENYYAI